MMFGFSSWMTSLSGSLSDWKFQTWGREWDCRGGLDLSRESEANTSPYATDTLEIHQVLDWCGLSSLRQRAYDSPQCWDQKCLEDCRSPEGHGWATETLTSLFSQCCRENERQLHTPQSWASSVQTEPQERNTISFFHYMQKRRFVKSSPLLPTANPKFCPSCWNLCLQIHGWDAETESMFAMCS